MEVFNAIVLPVLLHGVTARALTKVEEKRLHAFERRLLRNISGVRWVNMIRKVDNRERLRQLRVSLKLKQARMK